MKVMTFLVFIPILAGWISGWVVNYLADTLPATRRLSHPACANCGQAYDWRTYLGFGPCPNCQHRGGVRAWIVQVLMICVSLYTWFRPPQRIGYTLSMLMLVYFAVVIVIDLEHRLILHPTSIVGALLGLGVGFWAHGIVPTLLGGLGGFAIMLVLYYLGVLFTKFRARRLRAAGQETDDEEALGAGDVMLAGVLGLMLGWPLIWFGLLLGILLGGLIGLILMVVMLIRNQYAQQALMVFMPYGPFFIASAFFIIFLPNWITQLVPK